jgi:multicomponent Na+:H+ antiporter subunit E
MTKSTQTTDPATVVNSRQRSPRRQKNSVIISLFVSLFMIWLMLNSSLAWQVWALGAVLCMFGAFALSGIATAYADISITPRTVVYYLTYMGVFFVELVKSNLAVATLVLMPKPDLKPAIIQVKTELKSSIGRLALANSITLTPGTLVVEIRDDSLFIHCINVSETHPAKEVSDNVKRFEKYLKVVYG